jgi:glycosyltransferase involved in cell wall biosynthesis
MINNKKIVVIMPAYNAAETLSCTYHEIPFDIVDDVVLVDDCSGDNTVDIATRLNIKHVIRHKENVGYGGNQKSCYTKALELGADIIIMLHPDYQYTPKLVSPMSYIIANGLYDCVLGSRILGKGALKGGMPLYKYVSNRFLTFIQNLFVGEKLSEYHTGYRAFSSEVLRNINYMGNSNDFIFDNQILSQIIYAGYKIAEITCPTKYFDAASSIDFTRSVRYGLGVLAISSKHFLQRTGLARFKMYEKPCSRRHYALVQPFLLLFAVMFM